MRILGDARANLRIFTVVVDTHRPIVDQFDVHQRLEYAVLDALRFVVLAETPEEIVVQLASSFGVRGFVKVGLLAFFQLAKQCELRYCSG